MKKRLQVMKFGGTSVGDATCIARTAKIIAGAALENHCVAVVSAMSGVTNRLVAAAKNASSGEVGEGAALVAAVRNQHEAALLQLISGANERTVACAKMEKIFGEAQRLCEGTAMLKELTPRTLDALSSVGERLSAPLVAGALNEMGVRSEAVEATDLVVTDAHHGGAEPRMDLTREKTAARIAPLLRDGIVPVITGFIGATADGILTTLGRGGSDYSATILGAALDADEVIIR